MNLSKSQQALIRQAATSPFGIVNTRDGRAGHALCKKGLMKHLGAGRHAAETSFQLTDEGRGMSPLVTCGVPGTDKTVTEAATTAQLRKAANDALGVLLWLATFTTAKKEDRTYAAIKALTDALGAYGVPETHERQCECMDCALAPGVGIPEGGQR